MNGSLQSARVFHVLEEPFTVTVTTDKQLCFQTQLLIFVHTLKLQNGMHVASTRYGWLCSCMRTICILADGNVRKNTMYLGMLTSSSARDWYAAWHVAVAAVRTIATESRAMGAIGCRQVCGIHGRLRMINAIAAVGRRAVPDRVHWRVADIRARMAAAINCRSVSAVGRRAVPDRVHWWMADVNARVAAAISCRRVSVVWRRTVAAVGRRAVSDRVHWWMADINARVAAAIGRRRVSVVWRRTVAAVGCRAIHSM
jgi:hypothetical protein